MNLYNILALITIIIIIYSCSCYMNYKEGMTVQSQYKNKKELKTNKFWKGSLKYKLDFDIWSYYTPNLPKKTMLSIVTKTISLIFVE